MNIHIHGMPSQQELDALKIREFGSVAKADAVRKYAMARTDEIVKECAKLFDINENVAASVLMAGIEANKIQKELSEALASVLGRFKGNLDEKARH